jgi:hypothetical protein
MMITLFFVNVIILIIIIFSKDKIYKIQFMSFYFIEYFFTFFIC